MRDDFTESTRTKLALQAGYRCSYCDIATSGPSDESPYAVVKTGMAAHIHAASPGGPRYLATMTSEQRKDISNGIWMCRNHGTLIDEDPHQYTAESLQEMKRRHLAAIADEQASRSANTMQKQDLIALGHDLVMIGELVGISHADWSFKVHHYVVGSFSTLVDFPEHFVQMEASERYLLMNELGDGRQLIAPPSIERTERGYLVRCPIAKSFARLDAHRLPRDLALNDGHDLFPENGLFAEVSGLNALPQKIKCLLSLQYGESPFYPSVGSRLTEYFELFRDSVWFAHMLKLEVIRQASIPYDDPVMKQRYTPLMSIRCVHSVTIVGHDERKDWTILNFRLEVEGVGHWERDIPIFIPQRPMLEQQ
jgi:hypothetical protein